MLGTKTLRGGKAKLRHLDLPVGRNTIQVIYSGSGNYSASKATLVENVKAARTNAKAPSGGSAALVAGGMPPRKNAGKSGHGRDKA